ncbi:30S ribosomal protein S17e [Methanopyrus kandleri]|jgi:small subunit ribosomal protein S17e|uniref:Small ribosomal subunit protein eS17 n=2 Tax=Methanopyrus kandleri TaxID=2320 RepID=RS17E_METKA|nr:30S ribosomal protein S17e [Methanopyrus kandleri]Q8TUZ3.1 RecName: Full=Small ribosomal subunit protein eS17; AltName: Full=30S ribosomal protein S17e [Methanopyrus kandleri AV19]AAM02821.1 Ribosomal protein S17E [Methanopyrus kandleri AV19]HII71081.1 30S ribosomal protein S17e [Methanopyrus kandleri]
MGKVRPTFVKRPAREIVEKYEEYLTTDFEHNKKVVEIVARPKTKKLRNMIAGYVTHLMRLKERQREEGTE